MSEDLINSYKTRMESPDCHPGSTSFNIFISFDDDITEVLPYLNAELKGSLDYRHKDRILLWEGVLAEGGGQKTEVGVKRHALRCHEIAVSTFQDEDIAQGYAKSLVAMINDVWARRAGITPKTEGIAPMPKALDIWKILPRTNCKKCGFPTCMAYAVAVREDRSKIADCEHLSDEDFDAAVPQA